ncbi:embryonic polarity protein dorsal-like isoform X2 [Euwallacea fornicatus]|uniref:embryonic polarity protein dorsal-like isoform X2 n=1 Tax=Euwallacea fornicatus TaxID=995702 RepID=UPI00338F1511
MPKQFSMGETPEQSVMHLPSPLSHILAKEELLTSAKLIITEQPAAKSVRFRYKCEGRTAGSIAGVSSTMTKKTCPEVQICGYQGNAVVVVSCVTVNEPYLVHPHNLVGQKCRKGVYASLVPVDTMKLQFNNLGVQYVKKKNVEVSLNQRESIKVDPFRNGYAHKSDPASIDPTAVRLCFHAFLENPVDGKFTLPLTPVVSDVIFDDRKPKPELTIVGMCACGASVSGGSKVILLCEKVIKEDIKVHFFENDQQGTCVWFTDAKFETYQVHKQAAIWFKAPPYRTWDVIEPVSVFIQLYRPSDKMTSEPCPFTYFPLDPAYLCHLKTTKRKREEFYQSYQQKQGGVTQVAQPPLALQDEAVISNLNIPNPLKPCALELLDLDDHQIDSGDLQKHLNEVVVPNLGSNFSNLSLTDTDLN